ncbi:MAG: hypothetical protein KAJ06_09845, partial [Gammaproteobacteria bacterium]|nr:hypothetical protein [Gammaproteobacteria bacterium]
AIELQDDLCDGGSYVYNFGVVTSSVNTILDNTILSGTGWTRGSSDTTSMSEVAFYYDTQFDALFRLLVDYRDHFVWFNNSTKYVYFGSSRTDRTASNVDYISKNAEVDSNNRVYDKIVVIGANDSITATQGSNGGTVKCYQIPELKSSYEALQVCIKLFADMGTSDKGRVTVMLVPTSLYEEGDLVSIDGSSYIVYNVEMNSAGTKLVCDSRSSTISDVFIEEKYRPKYDSATSSGAGVSDHSALTNLNWDIAGHIINTNVDFDDNEAIGCNAVRSESGSNLVLQAVSLDVKLLAESGYNIDCLNDVDMLDNDILNVSIIDGISSSTMYIRSASGQSMSLQVAASQKVLLATSLISMYEDCDMNGNDIDNIGTLIGNGTGDRIEIGGRLDLNGEYLEGTRFIYGQDLADLPTNTIQLIVYDVASASKAVLLVNYNGAEVDGDFYIDGDLYGDSGAALELASDIDMNSNEIVGSANMTFIDDNGPYWQSNLKIQGDTSDGTLYLRAKQASGDDVFIDPDDTCFISGGCFITGALSKGSGSCLTTDIFYNSSNIQIVRGMVCISTGDTMGDRVYSKPISSVEPCTIDNDPRVVGVKVIEDIDHTEMSKKEFDLAVQEATGIVSAEYTKPLENTTVINTKVHKTSKLLCERELTDVEYEVLKNASISSYGSKLHIGILGQYSKVLVDADITPIQNGDMLTTSSTIGHGMKSVNMIPGTIFGKALQDKLSGRGYIRVLLNAM